MAINVKVVERPIGEVSYVRATPLGHGEHVQAPDRPAQGHDAVSRGEVAALAALARARTAC
jgi:hypothetical protein